MSRGLGAMAPYAEDAMPWDWRELMDSVCFLERKTGVNVNAEASYGPRQNIRCRVQGVSVEVRDAQSQTRIASTKVILDGVYGVTPQDKITLPDGSAPVILAVNQFSIGSGAMFEEVLT